MKKFLSLLLAVMMIAGVLPLGVFADEEAVPAEEPAVTEEIIAEEPAPEESAPEELTAEEPAAEPAPEEPVPEEPAAEEPAAEPAPEEPVPEEPAAEEPAAEPAPEEPAAEEPAEEPVPEEPAEEPAPEESAPEELTAEEPAEEPAPEEPAAEPVPEEPAAEPVPEEPAPEEGDAFLMAEPEITAVTMTASETSPNLGEAVILTATPVYTPATGVTLSYEWYEKIGDAAAKAIDTTTTDTYVVHPMVSGTVKYHVKVTVTNKAGSASKASAKTALTVSTTAKTSDCNCTGTDTFQALIDGGATSITIDNTVTLKTSLTIPAGVSVTVVSGGRLIVGSTGAKLTNKGKLYIEDGGHLNVNGSYAGNRIRVEHFTEGDDPTVVPATLNYGVDDITVAEITVVCGTKVTMPDSSVVNFMAAGEKFKPAVTFVPDNAGDPDIAFKYSSDIDGALAPDADGKIVLTTPGVHTITCTSASGGAAGTCKVTVEDYKIEYADNNGSSRYMFADSTLTVTAKLSPANIFGTKLKNAKLTYGMDFVTIDSSTDGDTVTVYVTAKALTENHNCKLFFETEDGKLSLTETIKLYPIAMNLDLYKDGDTTKNVAGSTVVYNISDSALTQMEFTGSILPTGAKQDITFSYSDSNNTAKVQIYNNGTKNAKVTVGKSGTGNEGSVTITATGANGVASNVVVRMKKVEAEIEVDLPAKKNYVPVSSGSKVTLTATHTEIEGAEVEWTLVNAADAAYATLNKTTGVFKAVAGIANTREIKVKATLKANGNVLAENTAIVGIIPLATKVKIFNGAEEINEGETILFNAGTEGYNTITLTGVVYPTGLNKINGKDVKINGKWTSSNTAIVSVDKNGTISSGFGEDGRPVSGTATLTFTTADGTEISKSIKVKNSIQVDSIKLSSEGDVHEMKAGAYLQLSARVLPLSATNAGVTYSIVNCDSSFNELGNDDLYASVSTAGKVSAKATSSVRYIKVVATAKDGSGVKDEYEITINPKTTGNLVILDKNNVDITTYTRIIDYSSAVHNFKLKVPAGEEVTWKSSNKSIATVTSAGNVKATGTSFGTVTITATDNYDMNRKATVKITVKKLVQPGQIVVTVKNGAAPEIVAGKKLTLVRTVSGNATTKTTKWSLSDTTYASISSSGVVTAKTTLKEAVTITAIATATDGSGVTGVLPITLRPKATSVKLTGKIDGIKTALNGNTYEMDIGTLASFKITSSVATEDASQKVTWKSSDTTLATVSSTGKVTFNTKNKTGTVTITATANDGSAKKATVKLKLIIAVQSLDVATTDMRIEKYNSIDYIAVRGGQTVQLKAKYTPAKTTTTKVVWSIEDPESAIYASITADGKLTAKTVTGKHVIKVVVRSAVYETVKHTHEILITPAVESLTLKIGTSKLGTSITRPLSLGTLTLKAETKPTLASSNVTWKSSNTAVATVSTSGKVTFKKAGTVKITATSKDGSGISDSVTIVITK